jgi:hypothetical protein
VTPDLIARLARLEQQIAAIRTQTFFETTAAARAAPRSTMTHLADMGSEAGTASSEPRVSQSEVRNPSEARPGSDVRPAPDVRATPQVRATFETGQAARRDPERHTGPDTARMAAAPATGRARTEEMTREHRDRDRFRDDRYVGDLHLPPRATERHRNGASSWAYWLLPLAALGGLGWYLLSGDAWRRQVADAPQTLVGTDTARPGLVVGGVDVGRRTAAAAGSLDVLLQGIKDPASASATLPRLQEAGKELDRMADMSGQLPHEGRTALAKGTASALAKLNTALDNAAAVPGVAPLLQPTLDQLRRRIDTIAMAPPAGRPYFAGVPRDWVPIGALLNGGVHNAAGERLGTVNEILLGPDGRVVGVIVGVGRDLGFGEKTVAIAFGASKMQRRDDGMRLILDATKEGLRSAPAFEPKR